jgi:hypothetical protein
LDDISNQVTQFTTHHSQFQNSGVAQTIPPTGLGALLVTDRWPLTTDGPVTIDHRAD